jgi:hypothetical protein
MTSLRVSRLATAIGAARTWSAVPNGSKMAVRVEGCDGKQETWLSAAEHAELLALLDHGPPSLEDAVLGKLVYSVELQRWEGAQNSVRVSFDSEEGDAAAESLAQGRRLLSVLRETTDRAASYSATKLLETKNGIWLQPGELPQTHETFVAALKLQSLVVKKDGAAELWFSAADLFWGHSVQVVVDASGQPTLAVLAG